MVIQISNENPTRFQGIQAPAQAGVVSAQTSSQAPAHPLATQAASAQPTASPLHFKAQVSPQIRFGHQLTEDDYVVTHRLRTPVNAYAVSKTLRAQMLRDWVKREQDDNSTLKYSLNAIEGHFPEDEAALGDNHLLLDRGVDTLIESHAGPAAVQALMMTLMTGGAGRRYIAQDASMQLGPTRMPLRGKNHDQQINRELSNEMMRERETLIMQATGETDRKKVYEHLNGTKHFNSLQSLAYGKYGLVDAILVGNDQVLTREGLEQFYRAKKWVQGEPGAETRDQKKIDDFNRDPSNLTQITRNNAYKKLLQPLSKYSPESLVSEAAKTDSARARNYISSLDQMRPKLKNESDEQLKAAKMVNSDRMQIFARMVDSPEFKMMSRLPFLEAKVEAFPDMPSQIQVRGALPSKGLVYDDIITFNDAFLDSTAEQIHQALVALDQKKRAQKDPSNIKIMINSPGGLIMAAQELSGAISGLKTPVDVIVNGMAASCGAWMVAMATGNRFATPHSRIMIHQAMSGSRDNNNLGNQNADNIQAMTDKIVSVVAKSSGRNVEAVRKDFRQDTYLSPLEALFYGPKGLLDGIIVGADKVITREAVLNYLNTDPDTQAYLKEKYGSKNTVKKYLEDRLRQLREPDRTHDPQEWEASKGRDPFANPIRTIVNVAAQSAQSVEDLPKLKSSATRPQNIIDQFIIGRKPLMMSSGLDDDDDDKAHTKTDQGYQDI